MTGGISAIRGKMRTEGGDSLRKSLLIFTLLIVISTPAAAQYNFIGLYANEGHEIYAYCPGTGFHRLEMWIWCLPGANGQKCAEFRVSYPANIIQSTVTPNDGLISVSLGDLPTGISVCYITCQHDWHWIYHQTLWVTDPTPGYMRTEPHFENGQYQIASCLEGYPEEPLTRLFDLYYNDPCPPGG